MSRDKLILSGVVLLGLLGFLTVQQFKKDEALGKPAVSTADFPSLSAPEDVDKISLTNGDKGEIVLERVPDHAAPTTDAGPATVWQLTKPVRADANQASVKDLLANLKDLKVSERVNLHLDESVKKDKQLDAAHALHLVAWKGGLKKTDVLFGKSGAAGELVIAADKPDTVWAAKGYSSYLYTKEAKDFRDKDIIKVDEDTVSQVTLTNSHGTFVFVKGDRWTGTLNNKPLDRLDVEKVKDLVRALKGLNANDFGDGKSLAETGLDKPQSSATVRARDNKQEPQTVEVVVGNVSNGTDRYAKRVDRDTIYQITSYVADQMASDASKFQVTPDGGTSDGGKSSMTKVDHKK